MGERTRPRVFGETFRPGLEGSPLDSQERPTITGLTLNHPGLVPAPETDPAPFLATVALNTTVNFHGLAQTHEPREPRLIIPTGLRSSPAASPRPGLTDVRVKPPGKPVPPCPFPHPDSNSSTANQLECRHPSPEEYHGLNQGEPAPPQVLEAVFTQYLKDNVTSDGIWRPGATNLTPHHKTLLALGAGLAAVSLAAGCAPADKPIPEIDTTPYKDVCGDSLATINGSPYSGPLLTDGGVNPDFVSQVIKANDHRWQGKAINFDRVGGFSQKTAAKLNPALTYLVAASSCPELLSPPSPDSTEPQAQSIPFDRLYQLAETALTKDGVGVDQVWAALRVTHQELATHPQDYATSEAAFASALKTTRDVPDATLALAERLHEKTTGKLGLAEYINTTHELATKFGAEKDFGSKLEEAFSRSEKHGDDPQYWLALEIERPGVVEEAEAVLETQALPGVTIQAVLAAEAAGWEFEQISQTLQELRGQQGSAGEFEAVVETYRPGFEVEPHQVARWLTSGTSVDQVSAAFATAESLQQRLGQQAGQPGVDQLVTYAVTNPQALEEASRLFVPGLSLTNEAQVEPLTFDQLFTRLHQNPKDQTALAAVLEALQANPDLDRQLDRQLTLAQEDETAYRQAAKLFKPSMGPSESPITIEHFYAWIHNGYLTDTQIASAMAWQEQNPGYRATFFDAIAFQLDPEAFQTALNSFAPMLVHERNLDSHFPEIKYDLPWYFMHAQRGAKEADFQAAQRVYLRLLRHYSDDPRFQNVDMEDLINWLLTYPDTFEPATQHWLDPRNQSENLAHLFWLADKDPKALNQALPEAQRLHLSVDQATALVQEGRLAQENYQELSEFWLKYERAQGYERFHYLLDMAAWQPERTATATALAERLGLPFETTFGLALNDYHQLPIFERTVSYWSNRQETEDLVSLLQLAESHPADYSQALAFAQKHGFLVSETLEAVQLGKTDRDLAAAATIDPSLAVTSLRDLLTLVSQGGAENAPLFAQWRQLVEEHRATVPLDVYQQVFGSPTKNLQLAFCYGDAPDVGHQVACASYAQDIQRGLLAARNHYQAELMETDAQAGSLSPLAQEREAETALRSDLVIVYVYDGGPKSRDPGGKVLLMAPAANNDGQAHNSFVLMNLGEPSTGSQETMTQIFSLAREIPAETVSLRLEGHSSPTLDTGFDSTTIYMDPQPAGADILTLAENIAAAKASGLNPQVFFGSGCNGGQFNVALALAKSNVGEYFMASQGIGWVGAIDEVQLAQQLALNQPNAREAAQIALDATADVCLDCAAEGKDYTATETIIDLGTWRRQATPQLFQAYSQQLRQLSENQVIAAALGSAIQDPTVVKAGEPRYSQEMVISDFFYLLEAIAERIEAVDPDALTPDQEAARQELLETSDRLLKQVKASIVDRKTADPNVSGVGILIPSQPLDPESQPDTQTEPRYELLRTFPDQEDWFMAISNALRFLFRPAE